MDVLHSDASAEDRIIQKFAGILLADLLADARSPVEKGAAA
jgi:hypothetical protein